MSTQPIKIAVIEGQGLNANGVRTVAGTMMAGLLSEMSVVPHRDYDAQEGYQRLPSRTRVVNLAHDLTQGTVDLPTAVLLNIRDFDDAWLEMDGAGGTLSLPIGTKAYVVDGQHRIAALTRLIKEDQDRWSNFLLHFVMMLGAGEKQEMRQFFVVNSTAKSVRTDLALDLLHQQANSDANLMASLIDKGESWKVKAQALAHHLGCQSGIWKGRIRFPGKAKSQTTITNSAMVGSLQVLMNHPYFGVLNSTENEARILDAYWLAIRRTLPSVFEDPGQYSMQKGLGALTMHGVFPAVLEVVRSRHESLVDPESYEDVIGPALQELAGSTADGTHVQGADFWRQGPAGAAGQFSSSAGRRVLRARIMHQLPPPEVA